jgi:2-desacetyl-2-hydroxyethyl bacteriochlorophyllide A dehydrogenase
MSAAVFHGPGSIVVEQLPVPEVGPADVLLRITAVGICGSDLHTFRTGMFGHDGMVMGHELCGVVEEKGDEVEGIEVGARATGFSIGTCGRCYWCLHGQSRMCPELFANYSGYGRPGAMAELMLIKDAAVGINLFQIPDGVSDEDAALAEPLGTAFYAVRRTKVQEGDKVVVLGAGSLGTLTVQAVKTVPGTSVLVSEPSAARRKLAGALGADVVIDPLDGPALRAVQGWSGVGRFHFGEGGMADVVIDAAGARGTFAQSLEFVRSLGTVGLLGIPERPVEADLRLLIHKDVRVVGILGSLLGKGVESIASGSVEVRPLITHRLPLNEAPKGFALAANDPTTMKVMLFP